MEELSFEEFLKLSRESESVKKRKRRTRLKSLDELLSRFDEAHKAFYDRKDRSFWYFHEGPCIYFHKRTIETYREHRKAQNFHYQQLLMDIKYLEYHYATLTAWGLNRPGTKLKLKNFQDFVHALRTPELISSLNEIKDFRLEKLLGKNLDFIKEKVTKIYSLFGEQAKVTLAENHLITTSKTLHHLHPDLLPPIDREYTLRLLGKLYDETYRPSRHSIDFHRSWWKVFLSFHYVAQNKKDFSSYTEEMDTSIPKIIDNVIIGYSSLDEQ